MYYVLLHVFAKYQCISAWAVAFHINRAVQMWALKERLPLEILHKVLQELTHILSMISYCCWSRKGRRIMSMMKIETMITMCIILMIIPINNMTMMIIIQAKVC